MGVIMSLQQRYLLFLSLLLMDLLTVDCSINRLKLFQKGMDENDLDDNKGSNDWSNYVIRFAGKRSSDSPICNIHKLTLAELYHIVRAEADLFESCLRNEQLAKSFHKRSVSDCQVYRQTLVELFEIVKEEAEIYENCLA